MKDGEWDLPHYQADRMAMELCAIQAMKNEPCLLLTPVTEWRESASKAELDNLIDSTPLTPPFAIISFVWADHSPGAGDRAPMFFGQINRDYPTYGTHRISTLDVKPVTRGGRVAWRNAALLTLDGEGRRTSLTQEAGLPMTGTYELEIILCALAMCNVMNIGLHEQPIPRAIRRPLEREHGKLPGLKYHALHLRNTPSGSGRVTDAESQVPLHLVRGHFVHYTEAAKMFGKYAGTFWCPAHERGDAKFGEVRKSYIVDAPTGD